MKKRYKIWLIPMLVVCFMFFSGRYMTAYAAGGYHTEGYFEYSMTADSITIESYFGSEGEVVIPDHIAALPVTKIANATFAGNDTVTKVTIPDTVTEIGSDVFTDMEQLKEVVVQSVGLTVKVPSGCKLTEDYPAYANPDRNESSSTDKNTTQQKPATDNNSGSNADSNTDNNAGSNTDSKNNNGDSSGVGFEAAAENADATQDRPGIRTADNKLITVDDTNNLIEIDPDGNITVLDRNHNYSVTVDDNGEAVITDDEKTQVSLDKDGKSLIYTDKDGNPVSRTGDAQKKQKNSSHMGILIAVIAGVLVVVAAGVVVWKKKKQH